MELQQREQEGFPRELFVQPIPGGHWRPFGMDHGPIKDTIEEIVCSLAPHWAQQDEARKAHAAVFRVVQLCEGMRWCL
ncbi:hypothetical protein PAPYR_1653 [Paratrimastix pyriformis]|uniref:Uncharacterized protein n=1 Tax=Paratrimastix pyriformis TaxID=342808 RepID=A0ABQ8US34_9EUKA|nr:hypothetical protein PAPYR_1653 [Paratrimastix pyriformis]